MNLLETYTAVLKTAKLTVSEDGYVSSEIFGEKKPFLVDGKRLVLPTKEQLRNPDKENRILFHALWENPLHYGESVVLSAFRSALNTRLNASFALLFANLFQLATSVAEHKKLNPDQSEFLSEVKDTDEKTFDRLAKIINEMPLGQNKKAFISIYLKKGGKINGQAFKKAAIVTFPFYEELLNCKDHVYGIQIRQKDKNAFINLMKFLFVKIDEENAYSSGSNSDVAPSLECIMGALGKIGEVINCQAETFRGIIDDTDEILIDHNWVEAFQNIERLLPQIRQIPPQIGNEPAAQSETVPLTGMVGTKKEELIPIKEKLEFVGLPNSRPAFNSGFNPIAPQPIAAGGGKVSLNDAMAGFAFGLRQTQTNQGGIRSTFGTVGFGVGTPFGYTGSKL